ncbi:MAG: thioredoxin domain-containing protein [Candidatus Solibacter sp.]|nr:thioredoxin domain-containing protein [Candidatus Solibacter sp.]
MSLPQSRPAHTNRLIHENSPYLLQHAHNPVDWYAWGEEAFKKARAEDKPIFLSIGYSTCHWCHVMERESFESEATARILNEHFVSVKLDREERPDIDRVYMAFVQATTGSGGWPMSVFLTPELKPFYGGTYFPPDNRYGRPGFGYLLDQIAEAWSTRRQDLMETGVRAAAHLESAAAVENRNHVLDTSALERSYAYFRRTYDARFGGFGHAPKFPRPSVFQFLFRYHRRIGDGEALDMALHTLREMAKGGMNDHLGGGFHRYSVDERWHVPHFEKMLYDQAQLAVAYLEAYQITGDRLYSGVAARILGYVQRELTHPEGGFYSAEDADSAADAARPNDKSEGAFYIWSAAEIREALGEPAAAWFMERHGCRDQGNAVEDPHGEFTGRNILFEAVEVEEIARRRGASRAEVEQVLAESAAKLLELRGKRPRPHLDDKILAGWNGMMISAFALAARVFQSVDAGLAKKYLESATRAAAFMEANLREAGTGGLLRRWRDGSAAVPAFLDDHALVSLAFIDLYEATFDPSHLETALDLARRAVAQFEDRENGGFYSTSGRSPDVIIRMKDDYDGAEPAGNSSLVMALLRLGNYTRDAQLQEAAERALQSFASRLNDQGPALPALMSAWIHYLEPKTQVVFSAETRDEALDTLAAATARRFLPEATLLAAVDGGCREALAKWIPEVAAMAPVAGNSCAYVCRDFACLAPVTTPDELAKLLN